MQAHVSSLAKARMQKLNYRIFPGNGAGVENAPYQNSAYNLWLATWQQTFQELKTDSKVRADDFVRQDFIGALFQGEVAVGMLLHTYFDLELAAVRDHSYLSTFPLEILQGLRAEGHSQILTMEYLSLDSKWRKTQVEIPVAEIILGLGAKLVESVGLQAIAVTRNAKRVNEILYTYGAECMVPGLKKHNVEVDLVRFNPAKVDLSKNQPVSYWVDYFWQRKTGFAQRRAA